MKKTRLLIITLILVFSLALVTGVMAGINNAETIPSDKPTDNGKEVGVDSPNSMTPDAEWPGPDGYGYLGADFTYTWVDITGTGTDIGLNADDGSAGPFPIGFSFEFYGTDWTDFYVSSNGFISFGAGWSSTTNQCPLPNSSTPNDIVPLLWDDLVVYPADGAHVYYQHFPVCPVGSGECLVVEYYSVRHYGGAAGDAGTWEAILFDNGTIAMQYLDAGIEEGSSSTTGIENNNAAADWGLTYACNAAATITDELAVQFIPQEAPRLDESSKNAPPLVDWGDPIHYTIEIVNTGELPALSTVMTDVIPYGTEYISGSLTCNLGSCWYDELANTVYWTGTVEAPPAPPIQSAYPPASPSGTPVTNLLQFGESDVSGNPTTPASSITANVLLDQPPNQSNGLFADADCDLCGTGQQAIAENFVLGSSVHVGQIVFWTGYYPDDTPIDPDQITVIFHEDAGGTPGAAVYTESGVAYERVQTGVVLFGVHEWMHTLTLATPLDLGPGTYWVEIFNDTAGSSDSFFWETGNLDPVYGLPGSAWTTATPGQTWNYDPGTELAIQIVAAPVIVEFDVQPLACGITVENEAVVNDPELFGGPVYLYASTEVLTTDLVYEEDFEADDGGFTISGVITNTWAWGDPTSGPFDAHSGVNLWATNLSGSYMNDEDGYISSPLIDLSAYTGDSFRLNWWQWYSGENCCDYISVEVTNDGGATWEVVYGPYHGGQVTELEWVPISVDLDDSYAVSDFQMRFHFASDASVTYEGWYVDDINLLDVTPCAAPEILVDAPPLHAYVVPTSTQTIPFDVCNLGEAVLDWSVEELSPTMTAVSFPGNLNNSPPALSVEPEIMRLPDGSVDCAAYENYLRAEPKEVAEQCNFDSAGLVAGGNGVLAPTDTGYAQDIGFVSDNFVTFTLNDFPGQTVIGTSTTPYYGMDFDVSASVLYALNDTTDELGTIDLTTGAFTGLVSVPPPVDIWTGLSIDPTSGVFYASTATSLYTIDPATGVSTLIGPFGTTLMIEIAVGPDGSMYGHDIGTDSIYSIDKNTGAATLIGLTGYAANFAQGMDFDNDDGTLYIFLYIGGGANVFGTVDLATGAVTPLATNSPMGEFEGAIQIPGFIVDIPWLSEAPTEGSLFASACESVDVTFDSTGMALGEYYAGLAVNSNDPETPVITLPVTMTVAIPVIELEKTVGLDPAVCADMDSIQVLAGAEVAYCYTVTNLGDAPLPLHDLVDSELGILLDDEPYDLQPGMSFELIVTATVDVDTTNDATWVAFVHEGFSAEASDSATVDVLWPEIELNKTVGLDPNACATTDSISVPVGTEVTYCFEVTNTGEETLPLHDLVDSELGIILDGEAYELLPGESFTVLQTATIMADTTNTATWTAYQNEVIFAAASDTATVTVYTPWIYLPLIMKDTTP